VHTGLALAFSSWFLGLGSPTLEAENEIVTRSQEQGVNKGGVGHELCVCLCLCVCVCVHSEKLALQKYSKVSFSEILQSKHFRSSKKPAFKKFRNVNQ